MFIVQPQGDSCWTSQQPRRILNCANSNWARWCHRLRELPSNLCQIEQDSKKVHILQELLQLDQAQPSEALAEKEASLLAELASVVQVFKKTTRSCSVRIDSSYARYMYRRNREGFQLRFFTNNLPFQSKLAPCAMISISYNQDSNVHCPIIELKLVSNSICFHTLMDHFQAREALETKREEEQGRLEVNKSRVLSLPCFARIIHILLIL